MAKRHSAKDKYCYTCGEHYEYCPTCRPQDVNKPGWMNAYCSWICHDVAEGLTRYNMGLMSLEEFGKSLAKYDLKSKTFTPENQKELDALMKKYEALKAEMTIVEKAEPKVVPTAVPKVETAAAPAVTKEKEPSHHENKFFKKNKNNK